MKILLTLICKKCISKTTKLTYAVQRLAYRRYCSSKTNSNSVELDKKLLSVLNKYERKILYNSVLDEQRGKLGIKFRRKLSIVDTVQAQMRASSQIDDVALSLKYLSEDLDISTVYDEKDKRPIREKYCRTHFPFKESISVSANDEEDNKVESNIDASEDLLKEVRSRHETFKKTNCNQWMTDYENFDDDLQSDEYNYNWKINYGTPDLKEPVSDVPCGGCGALLHCQVNICNKNVVVT